MHLLSKNIIYSIFSPNAKKGTNRPPMKHTKYAEREGRYLTKSKRMSVLLFLRQGMSNQKPLGEHGWVRFQANQMRRPTYKRQLRAMTMTSLQMGVSNQSRVLEPAPTLRLV